MSKADTERFYDEAREALEGLDRLIEATSGPGADYHRRRRYIFLAALEVNLDFRPPLVIRCDFDQSCQQTLARVYETSYGPLWVPSSSRKNDIIMALVELVDDESRLPLVHCNDDHHPIEFEETADAEVVARFWDLAQDRRRNAGARSVAVRR